MAAAAPSLLPLLPRCRGCTCSPRPSAPPPSARAHRPLCPSLPSAQSTSEDQAFPKDLATTSFHLRLRLADADKDEPLFDSRGAADGAPLRHRIDEDEPLWLCAAVELALKKMRKGCSTVLAVSPAYGFGAEGVESELLRVGGGARLQAELELLDFTNEPSAWEMGAAEVLAEGEAKKALGNKWFKAKRLPRAVRRYAAAKDALLKDSKMDDAQKAQVPEHRTQDGRLPSTRTHTAPTARV